MKTASRSSPPRDEPCVRFWCLMARTMKLRARFWVSGALVASVFLPAAGVWGQIALPAGAPAVRPFDGAPHQTSQPPGSEPALVTGRVVDGQTGAPIPAVVVAIFSSGTQANLSSPRVLTDAGGRFFFSGTTSGSYTLEATKAGWLPGAWGRNRPAGDVRPLELASGEIRGDVTIRMWRYGVVSGRVTDQSNDPMVAVDVRLFRQTFHSGRRQFGFVSRAITDDRGDYRFSSLVPGDYLIVVPAPVTSEPRDMRATAATPAVYFQTMTGIGTAPMSIRDRADVATASGQPLVSSPVTLPSQPLADAAWTTFATTYFPSTTSRSAATVVRVVAGRERPGTDIVVRYAPTVRVSGTLTLPDGAPAALHAVHLVPADSADQPLVDAATAVTDARGAFTFFGVAAGEYIARVVRTPAPGPGMEFGTCGGTGAISFVCAVARGPMTGPPEPSADDLLHVDRAVTVSNRDVSGVTLTLMPGARVAGRVEFEGTAATPGAGEMRNLSISLERADGVRFEPPGGFSLADVGRVSADGRFAIPSQWPGRFVVRVNGVPKGWFYQGATYQGRDISETPLDLRVSIEDAIITLSDRQGAISGTVQNAAGQPETVGTVLLFPAEPAARVDYGRSSRRVRSAVVTNGRYTLPAPPAGSYLVVAIPDEQTSDWQNPTRLELFAAQAERITVSDLQTITLALRTRQVP